MLTYLTFNGANRNVGKPRLHLRSEAVALPIVAPGVFGTDLLLRVVLRPISQATSRMPVTMKAPDSRLISVLLNSMDLNAGESAVASAIISVAAIATSRKFLGVLMWW